MVENLQTPEVGKEKKEKEASLNENKKGLENVSNEIIKGLETLLTQIESREKDIKKIDSFVEQNRILILNSTGIGYPKAFKDNFFSTFKSLTATNKESFLKALSNQQSVENGGKIVHTYAKDNVGDFMEANKEFRTALFESRKHELEINKEKLINDDNISTILNEKYKNKENDILIIKDIKKDLEIDEKAQVNIWKQIDNLDDGSTSRKNMKLFYEGDFSYFGKTDKIPRLLEKNINLLEIKIKRENIVTKANVIIEDIFNTKLGLKKSEFTLDGLKSTFKNNIGELKDDEVKSLYKKMMNNADQFKTKIEKDLGIKSKEVSELDIDNDIGKNYLSILEHSGVNYPQGFKDSFLSTFSSLSLSNKENFIKISENQESILGGGQITHEHYDNNIVSFMEANKEFRTALFESRKHELEINKENLINKENIVNIVQVYGAKYNYGSIIGDITKGLDLTKYQKDVWETVVGMESSSSTSRKNMKLFYEGDFSYFGKTANMPKSLEKDILSQEEIIKENKIIEDANKIIEKMIADESGLNDDGTILEGLKSEFKENIVDLDLSEIRKWYKYTELLPDRFKRDVLNDLEVVFEEKNLAEKQKQVDDIINTINLPIGAEGLSKNFHKDLNRMLEESDNKSKDIFFTTLITSEKNKQAEILKKISAEMEKNDDKNKKNYRLTFKNKTKDGLVVEPGDKRITRAPEHSNYLKTAPLLSAITNLESVFNSLKDGESVPHVKIAGSKKHYDSFISILEETNPDLYAEIEPIIYYTESSTQKGLTINMEKESMVDGIVDESLNRLEANIIGDNSAIETILQDGGFGEIINNPNVIITGVDIGGNASMNPTWYSPKLSSYEAYVNNISSNIENENDPKYTNNPGLALDRSLAFVKYLVDGNETPLDANVNFNISYDVQGDSRQDVINKLGDNYGEADVLEAFKERQNASVKITYKKLITESVPTIAIGEIEETRRKYAEFSISNKPPRPHKTRKPPRGRFFSGGGGGQGQGSSKPGKHHKTRCAFGGGSGICAAYN